MATRRKGGPDPEPETPAALGYRMPAEWEPHAATWLAWPHKRSDWPGKHQVIPWVFAEVARWITRSERVRMLVRSEQEKARAEDVLARAAVDSRRVDFFLVETDRSWTRDSLPLFVVRGGRERMLGAVKWRFNGWGRYADHKLDDAAGLQVARLSRAPSWTPSVDGKRVVLEGGAIDVDGEGTLLATEQCLLTGPYPRAAELGKAGIERALGDYLGIRKVVWLPDGIAGDDTTGHVDDFVRFVSPGRVLLCEERNRRDPTHRSLRQAREVLAGERDAAGRPLEIVALPMPEPLTYDGQRLPASYANFYLTNGAVLVPTFNDPNDRIALGVMAELFPDRKVAGIHCADLVLGLGTLHCSTQQEPAVGRSGHR
jgi:agmatine deiminase